MKPGWLSMLAPPSSIAKNSALLLAAFVAQKAGAFVVLVFLARHLGTAGFGTLAFVLGFAGILGQGMDLGVNVLLVRRVALARSESGALLGTSLVVKACTSAAALAMGACLLGPIGRLDRLAQPAMLALVGALAEQVSRAVCSIFVGHERMEFEAGYLGARALVTVVLVSAAILTGGALTAVVAAFCAAELVVLGFAFRLYVSRFRGPAIVFRRDLIGPIVREAVPIGAASLFGIVYLHSSRLLLLPLRGPEETGLFDAAYRVHSALTMIPFIAARAVYPVLSRLYEPRGSEARTVMRKVMKGLLLLALPVALGGAMTADGAIVLVYGEAYRGGGTALALMLAMTGLVFLSWVPKAALLAGRRGREFLAISAATALSHLALSVALIPRFGATGAAGATLGAEVLALVLTYGYSARMFPGLAPPLATLLKAAASAAVLVGTVLALRPWPLVVQMAGGAAAYTGCVACLRLVGLRDLKELASLRPGSPAPLGEPP